MSDLSNWTARPAPAPVTLKGRYVTVEPYQRSMHQDALWEVFGGMETNRLLQYFACPDFASADELGDWLHGVQTKGGWLTEVFRDKRNAKIVGMANYMRADPANGVVEVGGVAHSPE